MINFIKHTLLDRVRFVYYYLKNDRYRFHMQRFRACSDKKPKHLMKKELAELKRYWGCIPMQYYTHDFYRDDCPLSIDQMKMYIPSYYFYYIIYPMFDDVTKAEAILENKIICMFLFKGMGLPTSVTYAYKKDYLLYDSNCIHITAKEFTLSLKSCQLSKIFVKPASGRGGTGIKVLHKSEDGSLSLDGSNFSYEDLMALPGDYVVECGIIQSDYLNKIYSHSVNTLRAVTCRKRDGFIELIAVTLRMGSEGRQVDNGCQGGLYIGINIDTGKALRPYAVYSRGGEQIFAHPDTGFEFERLQIQNWNEVKDSIIGFACKMVLYNLIGWDIALTDDGPIVIEANTRFGIDHSQTGSGGMRDFFVDESPRKALFK